MMAHPLALQLRNLQSLVELGVDKNTTVVFPAPLMSTIGELGAFLARETAAAPRTPRRPTQPRPPPSRRSSRTPIPYRPAPTAADLARALGVGRSPDRRVVVHCAVMCNIDPEASCPRNARGVVMIVLIGLVILVAAVVVGWRAY